MHQQLVSLALDPGEPGVNLRAQIIGSRGALPFRGKTETRRKPLISADHSPPEVTFEVHSGREFFWSGIVTTHYVQIEEAIVVEVGETSAPRPSDLLHHHVWRL